MPPGWRPDSDVPARGGRRRREPARPRDSRPRPAHSLRAPAGRARSLAGAAVASGFPGRPAVTGQARGAPGRRAPVGLRLGVGVRAVTSWAAGGPGRCGARGPKSARRGARPYVAACAGVQRGRERARDGGLGVISDWRSEAEQYEQRHLFIGSSTGRKPLSSATCRGLCFS